MPRLALARDALPYLGGFAAAALLSLPWWPALAGVFFLLFLFIAFFFRDPHREHGGEAHVVLSPADGRVVQIREEGEWRALSIFLSVLDVHVNRAPVGGRVTSVEYRSGRFQAAFRHGASSENERNVVTIESDLGSVTAIQIAGLLARRIVCTAREGDRLEAGERIGLIKFGSRMDVLVPRSVDWTVEVGARVRAGVTVIGRRASI
ncbi:MAG: phosphatidylserine decarboxylase [Gemmatimonadetes bacterium]|nr:phosphatidylserine decarboxylase [Gemmatimonadota bacterium]